MLNFKGTLGWEIRRLHVLPVWHFFWWWPWRAHFSQGLTFPLFFVNWSISRYNNTFWQFPQYCLDFQMEDPTSLEHFSFSKTSFGWVGLCHNKLYMMLICRASLHLWLYSVPSVFLGFLCKHFIFGLNEQIEAGVISDSSFPRLEICLQKSPIPRQAEAVGSL